MIRLRIQLFLVLIVVLGATLTASGQGRPDPATLIAAQREAMAPLAFMDGVWRGPAWTMLPSGEKHNVTQTERIGPFLEGSVKVIEGRGYNADGTVGFNRGYAPDTRRSLAESKTKGYGKASLVAHQAAQ